MRVAEQAVREQLDVLEDAGALAEAACSKARAVGLSAHDAEEVAQQAYVELLQRHQGGREIRNARALIVDIASKRALNRMSRRRETPHDPDGQLLAARMDPTASVETRFEHELDVVTAAEAVAQLSPEVRRAFQLKRARVSPKRAAAMLGCSRAGFYSRASAGESYVADALLGRNRAFDEGKRRLISAYVLELGSLTSEQRKRVKRLLKDPHAAALASELRRAQDLLAGALPPLALSEAIEPGLLERVSLVLARARDQVSGLFGGGRDGVDAGATQVLTSGGTRGAGAAGAGGLAGILGAGGAKLAAVCGGAAATVACVAAVAPDVLPGGHDKADERPQTVREVRDERPAPSAPPSLLPSQVGHEEPAADPTAGSDPKPKQERGGGGGDQDGGAEPTPAPAPVVEPSTPDPAQQFGVEAAALPATGPAPADTNDSDGASAGTVRQEFGP